MKNRRPQILVVARASPIRDRTAALLESIELQKEAGLVKVVVLFQRRAIRGSEPAVPGMEYVDAAADWAAQVMRLAETSGCRWLVMPSSVDRYLPGAFAAVAEFGAKAGRTIVGACQVTRDGRVVRIGPDPFRFDYFALLSGLNYIAPGATFVDIDCWREGGGFHPRFPNCPTYEYLLRVGAADGVDCCPIPILETEAEPFPGIPSDWAPLYAGETLLATLNYNKYFVTSGAALGLLATLADRLEPYVHDGFHDEQVLKRLAGSAEDLKRRYIEQLTLASVGVPEDSEPALAKNDEPQPPIGLQLRLKSQAKRVMPPPIWDILRRAKRAYTAFRRPLY